MDIESVVAALNNHTAALNAHTAALTGGNAGSQQAAAPAAARGRGRPPGGSAQQAAQSQAQPGLAATAGTQSAAPPSAAQQAAAPAAAGLKAVSDNLLDLSKSHGRDAVVKVFKHVGITTLPEAKPEHHAKLIAAANAIREGREPGDGDNSDLGL